MSVFAEDIKKILRFNVVGIALTTATSGSILATDADGSTHAYSLDSIDTSKTYVDHTKAANTFNRKGTWRVVVQVVFSDGKSLHGQTEVYIDSALGVFHD